MHEFAVADQIYQSCIQTANYHNVPKIIEINVELGDFTLVVEELLLYSFNIVKKQSPITEESELVITRTPGIIECNCIELKILSAEQVVFFSSSSTINL